MLSNKAKSVFKYHFKSNLRLSLWFLGIYAVVIAILYILMAVDIDEVETSVVYVDSFISASVIFIFVVGITTYSTFLKEFVYQGVSRRDFFTGTTISILTISLMFTGIRLLMEIAVIIYNGGVDDWFGLFMIIVPFFLSFYAGYMLGLMIGMTFYGYGVIKGLLTVAISVVLINLLSAMFSFGENELGWRTSLFDGHSAMYFLAIVSIMATGVTVTVANYFLNRNISVKISTSDK